MSADSPTSDASASGEGCRRSALTLEDALRPLPYHQQIVDHLRDSEPELWTWFSSTGHLEEHAKNVRLELLKSSYRFERAEHADLYSAVDEVRQKLGVTAPVTVYQSQSAPSMNAFLSYVPGEAHVVLEGPVRDTLSLDELRATLAHELTHYVLWEQRGGELLVADQMLSAMASHPRAEASHVESARLFRLYLEVHADRGALAVSPEPMAAISSLIKIQTGLADASAESYLRQADEILSQAEARTEALTHPEAYIRARALQLWSREGEAANTEVARMIEGPLDLGHLTLLGQKRLSAITRRVLARFLKPGWLRTQARVAHARLFFADLDPERENADQEDVALLPDRADWKRESTGQYLCYVLLDLATADRQDADAALAAAFKLAEELELDEPFLSAAARELELGKRACARLRKEASDVVAAAAAAGSPEAEA